jgi:ABC-type branched-subunit amino acid transport system ATPase component
VGPASIRGLMLLDEPSEGLAPLIIRRIADIIGGLKRAA